MLKTVGATDKLPKAARLLFNGLTTKMPAGADSQDMPPFRNANPADTPA